MVNIPTPSDAAMGYTARDNPVTRFMDYLTQDANKSLLDKFLLSLSSAGLLSFHFPHGPITATIQCVGIGAAVAAYFRNRDGGKFRTLAAAVNEHHYVSTATAYDDGVNQGISQAYATAAADNEALQQQLEETKAELAQWEQSRDQLVQLQSSLELREEQLKLSADRETLNVEQQWAKLQGTIDQQQRVIAQLTGQRDEAMEVIETQAGQSQAAIAEALEQQSNQYKLKVAELEKEVLKLGAAQELAQRRLEIESQLLDYQEIIESSELTTMLFAGPPRSGKGTNLLAWLRAASQVYAGVVPIVIDMSEDPSWTQAGVTPFGPQTRGMFWGALRCLVQNLSHRKHTQDYDFKEQPLIVVVLDEMGSLFDGMETKEAKELLGLIRILSTRGQKRGVVVCWTNTDVQVQNMRSGPIAKVLNQGDLNNMQLFLFNSCIEAIATGNAPLPFAEGHEAIRESMTGEYQAACVTTNGGYRSIRMVRHASHNRQKQGNRALTAPIRPPYVVNPPQFFPDKFTEAYNAYAEFRPVLPGGETGGEIQRNGGETVGKLRGRNGIEAVRDVYPEDSILASETVETQNPNLDTWLESDEISPEERRRIIECHSQGRNQKTTVLEIYNRKPGRSRTYKCAAQKVRTVYGELSPVK